MCQTTQSWFKTLEGTIDKYPVTLHLHKAGNDYRGFYYYKSQQRIVDVFGNDTSYNGSIGLLAFTSSDSNEIFTFTIKDNNADGTWRRTERSAALHFTATVVEPPVKFTYVYTEGSVKLRPALQNSPEGSFSAASVWPIGNSDTDKLLKKTIMSIFNEKCRDDEAIGAMLVKEKKEFLAGYKEDNKDVKDEEISEVSIGYNNEAENKLMICYLSPDIVSLAYFTYSFSGGAHGNYGTSYTVVDLKNNKKLSLADIIDTQNKKKLNQLLEKNFRKQYNVKSGQSLREGGLFDNKIEANDNFYITGKGIGFCYNPYEIGPYVMGEINIFIPFSDLPASRGLTSRPSSAQAH